MSYTKQINQKYANNNNDNNYYLDIVKINQSHLI